MRTTPAPPRLSTLAQVLVNPNYRRVLLTGCGLQAVAMTLAPGESIGLETHLVEQLLIPLDGPARVTLSGRSTRVAPGALVLVPARHRHDLQNVGRRPLHLLTVYSPPNHLPDRVHGTREVAERDLADQAYERAQGQRVRAMRLCRSSRPR